MDNLSPVRNMVVISPVKNIEELAPIRRIRSALLQRGFFNKLEFLISGGDPNSYAGGSPKITRIVTNVRDHEELCKIIHGSDITLIHETSIQDQNSLERPQRAGYRVTVRSSSWRDSKTFHIEK